MISHASAEVQGVVRTSPTTGRHIPFQFVAIPAQLLRAGDLSFGAVVLLGVVADAARQNRSGLCKLTNAAIGARLGRSESEVGRYLLELEAAGLVAREFGRSKHVRAGIRLTWSEEVPEPQGTASVQVPEHRGQGPAKVPNRVPGLPAPIQSAPQNLPSDGPGSPLSGREAADFLRQCVAAAKAGRPMPEFPDLGKTQPTGGCTVPPPSPKGTHFVRPPAPTSTAPPDAFMPSIGRMVRALAVDVKAPDVGRRRVGPAELARQLAEMRRRRGRRE